MEISDRHRLSGLVSRVEMLDIPRGEKEILRDMIRTVDAALQDLVLQLKSQPTLFTKDPASVEGAKSGDVAIFKNNEGYVDVQVYD